MDASLDVVDVRLAVESVKERLARACQKAGRPLDDVALMAVTKNVPLDAMRAALECGVKLLGENRVQEAEAKRAAWGAVSSRAEWHMVGRLQSNKTGKAAALFDCIQSLDGLRLAERLDREGASRGRPVRCLVEVKTSEEPTKGGVMPDALAGFLDRLSALPGLRVEGLMTMAPFFDDPEKARPYFRRARALFDGLRVRFQGDRPVLSMGMSADFAVAAEEGATLVRVGTAIFGARPR